MNMNMNKQKLNLITKSLTRVKKNFYNTDTLTLAKDLLGKYFVRKYNDEFLIVKIVETEAYHETKDPACHAFNGKTKRNEVMFENPGVLYVYFTYGMHYCMNIVSEPNGTAGAILLRAGEPISGLDAMKQLRSQGRSKSDKKHGKRALMVRDFASGPAKLCQALAITKQENNHSLLASDIYIAEDKTQEIDDDIVQTTRIGLSKGFELPWRFYLKNSPFISCK